MAENFQNLIKKGMCIHTPVYTHKFKKHLKPKQDAFKEIHTKTLHNKISENNKKLLKSSER
jgi:hypothetical protein